MKLLVTAGLIVLALGLLPKVAMIASAAPLVAVMVIAAGCMVAARLV